MPIGPISGNNDLPYLNNPFQDSSINSSKNDVDKLGIKEVDKLSEVGSNNKTKEPDTTSAIKEIPKTDENNIQEIDQNFVDDF